MVCYAAILLSSMQCVEGFLLSLKNFDYWCSVGIKQPITSKKKIKTSRRRNEH